MIVSNNTFLTATIASIAIGIISTGAFNAYIPRISHDLSSFELSNNLNIQNGRTHNRQNNFHSVKLHQRQRASQTALSLSWLKDALTNLGLNFAQEKQKFGNPLEENDETKEKGLSGVVIRTATRKYDAAGGSSKPNSPLYTTKKNMQGQIILRPQGVQGDYNHYRTVALDSTPDRAVSILTTDILEQLKSAGYNKVQVGDLGENVYVDGVDYKFFEVGKMYKFSTKDQDNDDSSSKNSATGKMNDGTDDDGVIVQITERIEPCGNLCKLGFINDEALEPLQRFENCKKFLLYLDQRDGLRGWYGKVIGDGGQVKIGDQVSALVAA